HGPLRLFTLPLAAPEEGEEAAEQDDRERTADLHRVLRVEDVGAHARVVLKAVQNELVHGRADAAFGGLKDRRAEVLRRELDPVECPRELPVRADEEGGGAVGVLLLPLVPLEPEP